MPKHKKPSPRMLGAVLLYKQLRDAVQSLDGMNTTARLDVPGAMTISGQPLRLEMHLEGGQPVLDITAAASAYPVAIGILAALLRDTARPDSPVDYWQSEIVN